MSFTLPTFNLTVDIYTMAGLDTFATRVFRLGTPGQLRGPHRMVGLFYFPIFSPAQIPGAMSLLLPPLTDVRDAANNPGWADLLEVPSGSGRWYLAAYVDDVAKGFANEHRLVKLFKAAKNGTLTTFPYWPTPNP